MLKVSRKLLRTKSKTHWIRSEFGSKSRRFDVRGWLPNRPRSSSIRRATLRAIVGPRSPSTNARALSIEAVIPADVQNAPSLTKSWSVSRQGRLSNFEYDMRSLDRIYAHGLREDQLGREELGPYRLPRTGHHIVGLDSFSLRRSRRDAAHLRANMPAGTCRSP